MKTIDDFKAFINRVYENTKFKVREIYKYMIVESQLINRNEYFEFLSLLQNIWYEYKNHDEISFFLLAHYQEIFTFYLTKIFPFQLERLKCGNAKTLTPIDFGLVLMYRFNKPEIQVIDLLKYQFKIKKKPTTEAILKRIFLFSIASISDIIEKIYNKPFGCQFSQISTNKIDSFPNEIIQIKKDETFITVNISLREQ